MRTATTVSAAISQSSAETPAVAQQPSQSCWHYPIPYLLGGLVTMVALVICALTVLAYSFWKKYGEGGSFHRRSCLQCDLATGRESVEVFEDKVLVIMAGNQNPTYLAAPIPVAATEKVVRLDEKEREDEDGNEASGNCEDTGSTIVQQQ